MQNNVEILRRRLELFEMEQRYNMYHDPHNGRFTSGSGGGSGSVLVIPEGHKGVYKGFKAAMSKSISSANDMVAERLGGTYSFQENGGLQMFAGQGAATPTATININNNVASQATNSANPLTNNQNSSTINTKPAIENKAFGDLSQQIADCKSNGVKYNPVKDLNNPLSEKEIIDRLGGGDMTKGSCASLAMAYAANKAGYDVLDFRGGESQDFFSSTCYSILRSNPDAIVEKGSKTPGEKIKFLKSLPENQEYLFSTGRHCAIVKNTGGKVQYLELQQEPGVRYKSGVGVKGWKTLDSAAALTGRFRDPTVKTWGGKIHSGYTALKVDSLPKTSGFKELMGYINTPEGEQQKGRKGYAK